MYRVGIGYENRMGFNSWGCVLFGTGCGAYKAQLLLGAETVRSGETVMAGVQLRMDKGWHTYWRNSGGSGFPTTIDWQLPQGVTADPIQWPTPEKLPDKELTTYIYEKEVVLLVPLKIAADLRPGPLEIQANVSWLECQVECVKGDAKVKSTLTVADATKNSASADVLASCKKNFPGMTSRSRPTPFGKATRGTICGRWLSNERPWYGA